MFIFNMLQRFNSKLQKIFFLNENNLLVGMKKMLYF